jgi:predicted RNA-binding protein (virulence factor B family)
MHFIILPVNAFNICLYALPLHIMLQLGRYQSLKILRLTPPGLFLGDADGEEVLLPNKYVPSQYQIGDMLEVFIYLDSEERLIATTIKPLITLHEFALLKVKDVNSSGAFLDWGLEKDLFVPFKEQFDQMKPGRLYLVYLYEDKSTQRLVASQKIRNFLDNEVLTVDEGEEVDLIIAEESDLGVNVIVNGKHLGLIYDDDIFRALSTGDRLTGYVKKIRDDHKLDISLRKEGYAHIEPGAQKILDVLGRHNGFLPLHDGSDPEDIKRQLGMSKKTFKKALGLLYKQKRITLQEDGIKLL